MPERKTDKKEIGKEAKALLKQRIPKQQVFETLVDKYKYSKDIIDILRYLPSENLISKYSKWNNVLFGILIFKTILFLTLSPSSIISLLFSLLFIYVVAKIKLKYYSWLAITSVFASLSFIFFLLNRGLAPIAIFNLCLYFLIVIVPTLVLPIWLEKKLCPEPIERKELYTNSEGENRMRVVYQFVDI